MNRVRLGVLLASAAAALLIVAAAVIGLRGGPKPGAAMPEPPAAALAAAPAAVIAPTAAPAAREMPPSFDIVKVAPNGEAVVAGRAAPGARVRVLDGGTAIGEATADARGEWVVVPAAPIAPGERQLGLEATSKDTGNTLRSADVVALSVTPPNAANKGSALAILLPGDADQAARVLQPPEPAAGAGALSLDSAEYDARHRLRLAGRADPGARLKLYAGNQLLATATADRDGKWSAVAVRPQAAGGFELRVDQLAADGSIARRVAERFEPPVMSAAPRGQGPGQSYLVRRGNTLWWIARQHYGEGVRYTAIYTANRDLIRNPNVIYPGQLVKLPKS